jgi:hypothetical protein
MVVVVLVVPVMVPVRVAPVLARVLLVLFVARVSVFLFVHLLRPVVLHHKRNHHLWHRTSRPIEIFQAMWFSLHK